MHAQADAFEATPPHFDESAGQFIGKAGGTGSLVDRDPEAVNCHLCLFADFKHQAR